MMFWTGERALCWLREKYPQWYITRQAGLSRGDLWLYAQRRGEAPHCQPVQSLAVRASNTSAAVMRADVVLSSSRWTKCSWTNAQFRLTGGSGTQINFNRSPSIEDVRREIVLLEIAALSV